MRVYIENPDIVGEFFEMSPARVYEALQDLVGSDGGRLGSW
ncbi:MAG: hypothetical protein NDF52_02060 [archaeon YNP-WB-062]|nr:hypothetical protein [Candidatus Culexarchaeum yellowstonense]